jgi:glycosyltransferase involved in cell wall biosynthesis
LSKVILDSGVGGYVHFLGQIPEERLPALYRGADAVAYASLEEGFGLPILEGMASGVPVITSNVTAMPEIAAGAALLVDPYSVKDIAHGLDRITSDETLRKELVRLGRERLSQFDWDLSAAKLWGLVTQFAQCG